MDALTLGTLTLLAVTGYGEVNDGRPTWAQRELHTYTNLVRVDPAAWAADYGCSTGGFSGVERSPKAPLLYHDGLTEIAQLHSEDMAAHGFMAHESWDGTAFCDRVWPYYPGSTIGENVANGYPDSATALWGGWMCSSGHRANIMSASFSHLGCGIQGTYYTQDFGGGAGGVHQPVAMGVHLPEHPQGSVTFLATFDGQAPAWFAVETPGACRDLERFVGSAHRGGWRQEAPAESGCVPYRFLWQVQDGSQGALPETGAYQYGQGCELWVAEPPGGCAGAEHPEDTGDTACAPDDRDCDGVPDAPAGDQGVGVCGCSGAPAAVAWPALIALLGGLGLGRRR